MRSRPLSRHAPTLSLLGNAKGLADGRGLVLRRFAQAAVDFAQDIRPILEARCQPCHFPGGKVFHRLPFDRAQTIRDLGPNLFTRIKTPDEQATIRQFLARQP